VSMLILDTETLKQASLYFDKIYVRL
jgi:hypothetical protein